ncbi:U-box domain-containing protein [Drosera capensis]
MIAHEEHEETMNQLRKITRSDESSRIYLCTARLLAALRPLLTSRYDGMFHIPTMWLDSNDVSDSGKIPMTLSDFDEGFNDGDRISTKISTTTTGIQ